MTVRDVELLSPEPLERNTAGQTPLHTASLSESFSGLHQARPGSTSVAAAEPSSWLCSDTVMHVSLHNSGISLLLNCDVSGDSVKCIDLEVHFMMLV